MLDSNPPFTNRVVIGSSARSGSAASDTAAIAKVLRKGVHIIMTFQKTTSFNALVTRLGFLAA